MPTRITIRKPDDWHLHVRDGAMLNAVMPYTARHFGRAILMPNLIPPVTTTQEAIAYRERVMAAKLAAAALLGVLLGLFAAVVTVAIAELWFVAKGVHLSLGDRGVVLTLVGAVGASAIAGPLGVGVGGLLRRQTPAIVITLVWLLVGEGVVAVAGGARFAPGHAFAAVVSARGPHDDLLGAWSGVSVAAVYAAAFALGGTVAVVRRDVG